MQYIIYTNKSEDKLKLYYYISNNKLSKMEKGNSECSINYGRP